METDALAHLAGHAVCACMSRQVVHFQEPLNQLGGQSPHCLTGVVTVKCCARGFLQALSALVWVTALHVCLAVLAVCVWLQVMSTQGCWTVPAVCWTTACLSCSSSCRTHQGEPSQHRAAADCGRLHVGCTLAYVRLHPLRGGVGSRTCTSAVAHVSRRRCGC